MAVLRQDTPTRARIADGSNYRQLHCHGRHGGVLTVTSNEPINGLGDGDTAPDWQVIDAHHLPCAQNVR